MNDLIFGLDIGTRTVIGTLGTFEDKKWHVKHHLCMEHEERAMLNGQVHDIEKVAHIVNRIKEALEQEVGYTLKEVNIAAAGRVLNTQMAYVTKHFEEQHEIEHLDLQTIQVEGIEMAKEMLEKERKLKSGEYFCVGHTVINYFIEDYVMTNPEGHKGMSLSAKILATFLPKGVVDSLYAVAKRVGLHVAHLTLEPIAAINAVIPENIRLLNLALVDIGAGTSDIAITKEGSVVAYGMIPMAGDEVTETLVHKYLVDFNTAERMKQEISQKEVITYEDIIGLPNEVTREALQACIQSTVEQLARQIAKKIFELNGKKATNAVFCVGGGSQMPGLIEELAVQLKLPQARVALRLAHQISDVIYDCEMTKGPEMITPLGIAMTAAKAMQQQFVKVAFNEVPMTLMHTKKLTILDVLMHADVAHTQIFPTKGKSLMFKWNEERIRLKGENGEPSTLLLNGQEAHLETPIQEGDHIQTTFAKQGRKAQAILKNYIPFETMQKVYINGELVELPIVLVNGDAKDQEAFIEEGDQIQVLNLTKLGELMAFLHMEEAEKDVVVNGKAQSLDYIIQAFDQIIIQDKKAEKFVAPSEPTSKAPQDENLQPAIHLYVNQELIEMPYKEEGYLFVSIFDYIDFDLSQPKGTIQLLLNGEKAVVTDPVQSGDKIEIYWKK